MKVVLRDPKQRWLLTKWMFTAFLLYVLSSLSVCQFVKKGNNSLWYAEKVHAVSSCPNKAFIFYLCMFWTFFFLEIVLFLLYFLIVSLCISCSTGPGFLKVCMTIPSKEYRAFNFLWFCQFHWSFRAGPSQEEGECPKLGRGPGAAQTPGGWGAGGSAGGSGGQSPPAAAKM